MKNKPSYKLPVIISILLHAIIFALLFIHYTPAPKQNQLQTKVINAIAVKESDITNPATTAKKVESITPKVQPLPENTIRHIEQIALKQPEMEKIPISKDLSENTKKIPPPIEMRQKEIEKPLRAEQKIDIQKPNFEQKLLEKKNLEEKKKAELKKKEAHLAKQQQEDEAKQLQQEIAAQKKESDEETLENDNEQKEARNEHPNEEAEEIGSSTTSAAVEQNGEIDKYKQMIIEAISRKWLIPETENENKELTCKLLVHLGPGGVVMNIDILKESGDPNLDRSARNAIMKASPLPVPDKSELFDNFRALRLTFRPQGIISG